MRLRHVSSGAVVEVPEEKAERMVSEWQPAEQDAKAPAKRPATKRTPAKK
jgi:hypothetical protein